LPAYAEQVLINKPAVTIKGFTSNGRDYKDNTVTITAGASAAVVGSNDKSGTVRVAAAGVSLYNLKWDLLLSVGRWPKDEADDRVWLHGR
jgi:hypothetical protein